MPTGLAGILLASILAVAMSNASGSLNSLAASTVLDFSRLSGHQTDPAKFLRLSRRMTLVWGAVLIGFGLVSWGPLLEAGLTVASLPFGSLLGSSFSARSIGKPLPLAQPSACSRASPSSFLFGDSHPLHLRGMSSSVLLLHFLSAA